MKRLYILLLMCIVVYVSYAQKITRSYQDESLSRVLEDLNAATTRYEISFVYNDLEDFTVTCNFKRLSLEEALIKVVGLWPVRIVRDHHKYFLECTHKAERRLKGRIIDEQDNPVAYASVSLLSPADSSLVGSGLSNEAGYFVIPTDASCVIVRCSFVGYKTICYLCDVGDIGNVRMQPVEYNIKGIVVNGQAPIVRREAGTIIFDTRHVVGAINATDLLRYTPGLMVEDDNISLFGANGVIFHIDGREQRIGSKEMLQMLRAYSASDVERIEIVQSPGASYSAEGNAGVINIVLKKKGNDYIGGSAGYALTQHVERLCEGEQSSGMHGNEANAGIIYNRGKVSTSLNLAGIWDNTRYIETNDIRFTDNLRHGTDNGRISKDNYSLRWQADYHASDKLNFGTYVMYADGERCLSIDGLYDFQPKTILSLSAIDTRTRRQENTKTWAGNLNAGFCNKETGVRLDCNIDYYRMRMGDARYSVSNDILVGNSLTENLQSDTTDFDYHNHISHNIDNYSAKIDVSYAGFRLGSQYAYTRSHLDLDYSGSSVSYDKVSATYDERVLSGYLEYGMTIGCAWLVNLGGRYEHTWTKSENQPMAVYGNNTDYGKLFPSLRVGYNPSQSHAFNWSLSSRITRPNIINLNPNRVWRDVNHESFGNQNLKPSYLYKAMMGYTYKGVLNFDLYYAYEPDRVDAVYYVDRQITINSWDNITDEHSLGINSFFYFDKLRWMTATLMQGIWYSKTVRPENNTSLGVLRQYMYTKVENFSYTGMLQTTFFFDRDRKWTANLNVTYSSPEKDVTKSLNARYMVDAGLQWRFWKDRLTIGLICRNLLASRIKGTEYLGTTTMDFNNKFNYRQLRFSLTYNWGARLRHNQRHYESDNMQQRVVNDF